MNARKPWWTLRGHPRGLSTGFGMVGGLVLFATVVTGGIAATQIVRAHLALAQAAHTAARSEQQNGCWTPSTTAAVNHTLRIAGINTHTVKITAASVQSTGYGKGVTAGLSTQVGVSVLGASLMHVPVSATASVPSMYASGVTTGTGSACIVPTS